MIFEPIIKWIGSKRIQSDEIIQYFPRYMDTYYEPFCGGCSVLFQLLNSNEHYVGKCVVSDINPDLIEMWDLVKRNPHRLLYEYTKMWNAMRGIEDRIEKKRYFERIRREFNKTRSPYLFFFLMRTCTNGIPRYNKKGEFNNTFHITRDGIKPKRMSRIIFQWSKILNEHQVEFICCDYIKIFDMVKKGDFLYLDPPYTVDRSTGRYFGSIDHTDLFDRLCVFNELGIQYGLSYDGAEGKELIVPENCYDMKITINSKNGGYRKTHLGAGCDTSETLYIN